MRNGPLIAATCLFALLATRGHALAEPSTPSTAWDEARAQDRAAREATTDRDRDHAQYRLAIALHRAKLTRAAYGVFSAIVDHPNHAALEATLPWLARLATELPEPADVDERVARYDEKTIDLLQGTQREAHAQLTFLLGRFSYRSGQHERALRVFAKLDRGAREWCRAQLFMGLANVQLRRPIEAVQAFQRVVDADRGSCDVDGSQSLRDLAQLSIARTYYSASIRVDGRGVPAIHRVRLGEAVKRWSAVDVTSELWMDASFEQSWAYFMAGDHARALGNVHTLESVHRAETYAPQLDILRASVYVANCKYADAAALSARFHTKFQPVATELTKVLAAHDGADQDEHLYELAREVRAGRGSASPLARRALAEALADRQFLRHLVYVSVLEDEAKRLSAAPPSFRESALGGEVKDGLQVARDLAVRSAAELARARVKRLLDELDEHLRDNTRLLLGALAGQRGELDGALVPLRVPPRAAERNVVRGDEEHVIWPFTGELWSDEVGTYRQSIRSECR